MRSSTGYIFCARYKLWGGILRLEYVISSLGCDEMNLAEELSLIDKFEVNERVIY